MARMKLLMLLELLVLFREGFAEWTMGTPSEPPIAPQVITSSVTSTSMEVSWPRGDDAKVLYPTDWFEVQYRELNTQADQGWSVALNGGKVGIAAKDARREGQHESQVISVRVDRGEKIRWGYFQLAFNFGGSNYRDRYTDGTYATNNTAVITTTIPWNASASEVRHFIVSY
jgi:hypothetical protein